jgi:hypothetical protein
VKKERIKVKGERKKDGLTAHGAGPGLKVGRGKVGRIEEHCV